MAVVQGGSVGLFFEVNIEESVNVRVAPAERKVTGSLNVVYVFDICVVQPLTDVWVAPIPQL